MKAFWLALFAIAVIATGASLALRDAGLTSQARGTGPSVRLD